MVKYLFVILLNTIIITGIPSISLAVEEIINSQHNVKDLQKIKKAILGLDRHGLNSTKYINEFTTAINTEQDLYSSSFMKNLITDLRFGITHKKLNQEQNQQLSQLTSEIKYCKDIAKCWQDIAARHPTYEPLQMALEQYQYINNNGGWQYITSSKKLKLNDIDKRVPIIRKRLSHTADYIGRGKSSDSEIYDEKLQKSVKSFQERHGLSADGVIGPKTIKAMNVSVKKRIEQITLSLERLRRMPDTDSKRYVHVNIPGYKLYGYQGQRSLIELDVIVGKTSRQTPIFDNSITQVAFNPTWTPTKRIINKDILPKVRKNPNYLSRGGYKVYDRNTGQEIYSPAMDWSNISYNNVRIVQSPGRKNALGKIKFMLPNNQSVYLHDSSKRHLFKSSYRALSSGCIRLSDPSKFLSFVSESQERKEFSRSDRYYHSNISRSLKLDKPVRVITTYLTAWVNNKGKVEFYNDVYSRDDRMRLAMSKDSPVITMR